MMSRALRDPLGGLVPFMHEANKLSKPSHSIQARRLFLASDIDDAEVLCYDFVSSL